MGHELVIASIDRAADHAEALGIVVLITAVGGLVYGLVRLMGKSRAGRAHSDNRPGRARDPEA